MSSDHVPEIPPELLEYWEASGVESANDTHPTTANGTNLTADDLFAVQADAAWLVRELGIAPGSPTMLVGQGFVGKTMAAMSLGVSLALAKPIWGRFATSRSGRVLHLDYEQGRRITSSRFRRLVAGLGGTQDEIRGRWEARIFPTVNLTTRNAYDDYCRMFRGFDLVILDSLKAMTPGVEENSSAIRDCLHILTRASEATGATPLVIHHAGKTPMQGSRSRKEMGRGSSGIYDEAQSYFVLTGEKGKPVHVSHEKDRERGQLTDDFTLMIHGEDDGPLIVRAEARAVAITDSGEREVKELAEVRAKILELLRAETSGLPKDSLRIKVGKKMPVVTAALAELMNDGVIIHNGAKGPQSRFLAVPEKRRGAA